LDATSSALSGSLPKLAWLCDDQNCPLPADVVEAAAEGGSLEMLQWLKQRGCAFRKRTTFSAARRAHNIPVLRFLLHEGCDWHDDVCNEAAAVGDLEQLKWLDQHGAILQNSTPQDAARSGVVSIFEWLQQQHLELSCHVMSKAAQYGHLSLCKWLYNAGCPWDSSACRGAVDGGHLEVLRFLHDSGCLWNEEYILYSAVVATRNKANMLQYLWEQGVQADTAELTDLLGYAGSNDELEKAKWLRENGAQWPDVLQDPDGVPWSDHMPVVAWARAEGCTAPAGGVHFADN
jgi:hypothetical protein